MAKYISHDTYLRLNAEFVQTFIIKGSNIDDAVALGKDLTSKFLGQNDTKVRKHAVRNKTVYKEVIKKVQDKLPKKVKS